MRIFYRYCLLLFLIIIINSAYAQDYKQLHEKLILADTHNDILTACFEGNYSFDTDLRGKTHSDLKRFKEGGVDVQVFSIWCDGDKVNPYGYANRQIDSLYATAARNPATMLIVKNSAELSKAVKRGQLAAMIGVEGGHMIEDDMSKLDSLFARGARYLTLTWNNSSKWATSAMEETADSLLHQPKGLSDFGKQVVRHMNKLGMLVDLSHVGEKTFWDAIATTTKPVLVSHSSVYNICPVFRNLKDDQIKAVGQNGGVIHLNFFSGFLDSSFNRKVSSYRERHKAEFDSLTKVNSDTSFIIHYLDNKYRSELEDMRAPFNLLFNHLDYIVKLIGVDHVGLGSDFDGISSPPQQLDDVTTYTIITRELLARGYSKKDIEKIMGGNFLRLLKANEKTNK